MAYLMMLQAASFAPSIMTGTIPSASSTFLCLLDLMCFRVCAKLRNAAPGYNMTSTWFLQCLYEREDGDIHCPEDGFLKGPLLIYVSPLCTPPHSTPDLWFCFRHIVIYSHHHHLQLMRLSLKSPAGDMMSQPLFDWIVRSPLVRLPIQPHKYVRFDICFHLS
jgi:hypothetical protein